MFMLPFYLPLALLLILPLLVSPFAVHSGPTALVGGCFLGHVAFVGAWASRSTKSWLARTAQANLLVFFGWLALCSGRSLTGQPIEPCLFLLPLGLFFQATLFTLLESVKRRRLQLNLREVVLWTTIFAVVAAMAPALVAPPDSPMAAVMLIVGITFRLVLFSFFASFVAVPTLVVWDRRTGLRNKVIGLALVCVAGATLQIIVLGGLSLVTDSFVGSPAEIFVNGLCLNLGIVVVTSGSLMLFRRGRTFEQGFGLLSTSSS